MKKNNSVKVLNEALGIVLDCDGFEYNEEAEIDAAEIARIEDIDIDELSESNTYDDPTNILHYSCPFCQKLLNNKEEVINHVDNCDEAMDQNDQNDDMNNNLCCPYCQEIFVTEDDLMLNLDSHK